MPLSIVPNEILSPLTDIFGANIALLLKTFHDLKEEEDFLKLLNTLQSNNTTNQSKNSCQSHTKSGVIKQIDYQNPKRFDKAILFSYNIFYAKHISQSNTHII